MRAVSYIFSAMYFGMAIAYWVVAATQPLPVWCRVIFFVTAFGWVIGGVFAFKTARLK